MNKKEILAKIEQLSDYIRNNNNFERVLQLIADREELKRELEKLK